MAHGPLVIFLIYLNKSPTITPKFSILSVKPTYTLFKGKGSETVKPNQNESISKTKLFGANFMQIGLQTRKLLTFEN